MGKSDPVTVGSNDICHIIFHIRTQRSGTQTQTVVFIIYHMKKPSYRFFITKQSRNPENIPWGIILMDRHLDPGLMAGRHNGFQKILQVFPDFSGYTPPSPYNHPVSCFFHNITHWIHPPADEKDPSVSSQRSA